MPEYKRFIAYFYEYIDGRKQKNVGFAKVELRNGMWRILFRLTTGIRPEPPVQVYGFVRERGYLLGFPMGMMTGNGEIAQEWAYHAENPIGFGKYRLEDLSGIWIQSGEPRCFITVWDDDPVDPARFVLELPQEQEKTGEQEKDGGGQQKEAESRKMELVSQEKKVGEPDEIDGRHEENARGREENADRPEENTDRQEKNTDRQEGNAEESGENTRRNMISSEGQGLSQNGVMDNERGQELVRRQEASLSTEKQDHNSVEAAEVHEKSEGSSAEACISELLEKRRRFQPFMDDEIGNCVQILPCDIVRMQQENWQIGRSSFLQHGYYQYRHLLLGKQQDGAYVLGVPGILNQQEQYMAKMFGFDQFKKSKVCECGRVFGYWYRVLACGR